MQRLTGRRAEVECRLISVLVELAQLGHDVEDDVGRAERHVRQNERQIALVQTDGREQQHERYAHDGIRGGHRDVVDREVGGARAAAHVVDADGRDRAEQRRQNRGDDRDEQGDVERVQNIRIAEQLDVPFCREAVPDAARLGVVEGIEHEHRDRRVQEQEDQQQIKISEELFHSSRPPSSPEPSSNLFMIHMHRKMRSIMTSAIAEPRCGL